MSLYIRVLTGFYTHRKTLRLRAALGDDGFWIPPRLWSYAAEHQPDGIFKDYSAEEIAVGIGYGKDANVMLEALTKAGFMDLRPLRIHDWREHNGYHEFYAARARKAAETRWQKRKEPKEKTVPDKIGGDKSQALLQASGEHTETETTPPKLFPREIDKAIVDLKSEIKKVDPRDENTWAPMLQRLHALEIQKFGVTRTKPPKVKEQKSAPATTPTPEGDRPVGPDNWAKLKEQFDELAKPA